jgi:aspartyl/asparaginyl beta-hydroxylase (cupin superfamily)
VFPGTNNSLSALIDTARRAARAGQLDEAARTWEQVRRASPDHPEALFFFGQRALAQGDAAAAVQWLSRATQLAPKEALIPLALAGAQRALNNNDGEMAALEAALKADPYCYPALLAKAALIEKNGLRRNAARIYADALKIVPAAEDRLGPDLRELIRRARAAVAENAGALDAFIETKLGRIREAHGNLRFDRFDESKDALTGRKKIYTQQPVMLNFPRLPAIQFYDEAEFPWLPDLEAATDAVEADLEGVLNDRSGDFRPYLNHPDGVPLNETASLNRSADWSAYFLWDDGVRIDDHCKQCPQTSALLDKLPLVNIPGFAPAAFFSTLKPGARIPPHTGVTNVRLIVHLGLVIPGRCTFRVGNETREWQRGKAWIFDDTIEHEALNASDKLRAILIFDVWNPYLSTAERELVCALLAAQREYYKGDVAAS